MDESHIRRLRIRDIELKYSSIQPEIHVSGLNDTEDAWDAICHFVG